MAEAQITASGKVEVTAEVKALAERCIAEGLTAAEITDVSEEVRKQLDAYLRGLGSQTESAEPKVGSGRDAEQDIVEEDPRLTRFADNYNRFSPEDKERCPWEKVQERLLNNNSRYLALAEAMNGGGILFGVDKDGNPLFADDGEESIMTDMNYGDTRKAVYLKNPEGEWMEGNMTGYEMFPYAGGEDGYDKSDEILAFERFTGKPFVVSPNREKWRSSWLESGQNHSWPRIMIFGPGFVIARVAYGSPEGYGPDRGVRRLLRVKESI